MMPRSLQELVSLQRYEQKMVQNIQKEQELTGMFCSTTNHPMNEKDPLVLPIYALELLQNPKELQKHYQLLQKR
jgi:hypothetical protein